MVEPTDRALSEREKEILRLVAAGFSNKEIAQALLISPNTVKVHVRNIFAKIEVASRTEATLYALRTGLAPMPSAPPAPAEPEPDDGPAAPAPTTPTQRRWLPIGLSLLAGLILIGGLVWAVSGRLGSPPSAPAPTPGVVTWAVRPDLPAGRSGLALAVYEGQIYAIGGEAADGVSAAVERFDPAAGTWTARASKPTAVADVGAATIGGRVFVPGGRLASGAVSAQLEIYDPRDDTWRQGAPLPVPLSAYALAAFEGKLYVFGGWNGTEFQAAVYAYNPDQDEWTERAPMPTARGFAGAAVAGGKIYVIGGANAQRGLAANEAYSPEVDRAGGQPWQTAPPLPEARPQVSVASLADTIYVLGPVAAGATPPAGATLAVYLPLAQTWQTFAADPQLPLLAGSGLVAVEAEIHNLGGRQGAAPSPRHLAFQAIFTTLLPAIGK